MSKKHTRRKILKYSTVASSFAIIPATSAAGSSTRSVPDQDVIIKNNTSDEQKLTLTIERADRQEVVHEQAFKLASRSEGRDTPQNEFAGTFIEPNRGRHTLRATLPTGENETQDLFFTGKGLPPLETVVIYILPDGGVRISWSVE